MQEMHGMTAADIRDAAALLAALLENRPFEGFLEVKEGTHVIRIVEGLWTKSANRIKSSVYSIHCDESFSSFVRNIRQGAFVFYLPC